MLMGQHLGIIPDWQYSSDPAINIKINPHVAFPENFTHGQRTAQPMGYFSAKASGDPLAGLGITMARWSAGAADLRDAVTDAAGNAADYATQGTIFDSWGWRNRKWIALGAVGVAGGALLLGAAAILR